MLSHHRSTLVITNQSHLIGDCGLLPLVASLGSVGVSALSLEKWVQVESLITREGKMPHVAGRQKKKLTGSKNPGLAAHHQPKGILGHALIVAFVGRAVGFGLQEVADEE